MTEKRQKTMKMLDFDYISVYIGIQRSNWPFLVDVPFFFIVGA